MAPVGLPDGEREFQARVAELTARPAAHQELAALLREDEAIWQGKGRGALVRMRGWILAAFEHQGLPREALPFVVEELEAGHEPYLVAAAARALRGWPAPTRTHATLLLAAFERMRAQDDLVSFGAYGEYTRPGTGATACAELLDTLTGIGPPLWAVEAEVRALVPLAPTLARPTRSALDRCVRRLDAGHSPTPVAGAEDDGCCGPIAPVGPPPSDILGLALEDQDGERITFGELVLGRPTVVAFFYTRCENPAKCSLTVTRLARIQRALADAGQADDIGTVAVTYDPGYDLPSRLREYGLARGWRTQPRHRLVRAVAGVEALQAYFGLQVSFMGSLVGRHRLECFVLDAAGNVRRAFTRTQWAEADVLTEARAILGEERGGGPPERAASRVPIGQPAAAAAGSGLSVLLSVGTAFFPKCPLCWAAYMSMLGVAGAERIPYTPWLLPVFASLLLVNLGALWWRGRRRGRLGGFWLSMAGALTILVGVLGLGIDAAAFAGLGLTVAGSLWGVRRA